MLKDVVSVTQGISRGNGIRGKEIALDPGLRTQPGVGMRNGIQDLGDRESTEATPNSA